LKLSGLIQGTFLKRYKRFFADIELSDGTVVVAHCPNTGSMRSLIAVGNKAYLSPANNPDRKLRYSLEILEQPNCFFAMVNTQRPNHQAEASILKGLIPELAGYAELHREVGYGSEKSRIDLLLQDPKKGLVYIEVKNVTLGEAPNPHIARFPDAVTSRGTKHLRELIKMKEAGHRAVLFFVVNRSDATSCTVAAEIDPLYAETLKLALAKGVEVLAYQTRFLFKNTDCELVLDTPLPFVI
jgi:sugar fermentation stimulation protein A